MRIGIGLPVAVPGRDATMLGQWAAESEGCGFQSLGVIDRLVYDNLDPLVSLAAAAARTERVELVTNVINVGWRRNPVLLAKQLASLDLVSGGRLVAGLALGAWPEDYAVSEAPMAGRGAAFDAALVTMRKVWAGEVTGVSGPMPALPSGRPEVLIGGLVPAAFARVARYGDGWVAPSFGTQMLLDGIAAINQEWAKAGRSGRPRVVVERYFCLGDEADAFADRYLAQYYGESSQEWLPLWRADMLTNPERLGEELVRLSEAGCDDLVLLPCSSALEQVGLLAGVLDDLGASRGSDSGIEFSHSS